MRFNLSWLTIELRKKIGKPSLLVNSNLNRARLTQERFYPIEFTDFIADNGAKLKSSVDLNGRTAHPIFTRDALVMTRRQNPTLKATYRSRLSEELNNLIYIVFDFGSQQWGHLIAVILESLRKLYNENPAEHHSVVAADERYQKLWKLFPKWVDAYSLQEAFVTPPVTTLVLAAHARAKGLPAPLPDRAQSILKGNTLPPIDDALRDDAIRSQIIVALQGYTSSYKCSLFGHHHEGRAQAVIAAIQQALPIKEISIILTRQIALMTNAMVSPAGSSDRVDYSVLSQRWQDQLPKHRALPVAGSTPSNSGYLRALTAAKNIINAVNSAPVALSAMVAGH